MISIDLTENLKIWIEGLDGSRGDQWVHVSLGIVVYPLSVSVPSSVKWEVECLYFQVVRIY